MRAATHPRAALRIKTFPMPLLVTRNATNTQGCLNMAFAKTANNIYGRTSIEIPPNFGIVCLGILRATLASTELGEGHSSQRSGMHGRNHTKRFFWGAISTKICALVLDQSRMIQTTSKNASVCETIGPYEVPFQGGLSLNLFFEPIILKANWVRNRSF